MIIADRLPLVYISVLNWNAGEKTAQCIHSLTQLDYSDHRIIIVDNASQDNSVEYLHALFPEITIISSSENLGYAGGHRLAVEKAFAGGAELIWLLNNDLEVKADAL